MSMIHAQCVIAATKGALSVSMATGNAVAIRVGAQCWSGIRFHTDGDEDSKGPTNGWNNAARGQWLDVGASPDVWVQRTVNSGSLNDVDSGTGRLNLATTRSFSVTRASIGTQSANITFDMYDAASGGNLLQSVTVTISAEWSA